MSARALVLSLAALALATTTLAKFDGVLYEPFSEEDYFCLGKSEVAVDLKAIAKVASNIRLKSLNSCPDSTMQILEFAKKKGMQVMLGVFINGVEEDDEGEFEMLQKVLKKYDESVVSGVVVGDGFVFDLGLTPQEGAKFIEKGKAIVKKSKRKLPVGTAEAWNILEFGKSSNVTAKVSDFLCVNMQPYWGGFAGSCEDGADCPDIGAVVDGKAEVLALKFNKPTIICSTGWPSKGEKCCGRARSGSLDGFQAVPSVENAASFYTQLVAVTAKSGRSYFISDAFDADWKRTHAPCTDCVGLSNDFKCGAKKIKARECEVVYNFGIYTSDRKLKEIAIP